MKSILRRIKNHLWGNGPYQSETFEQLQAKRHPPAPLHHPESRDGLIHTTHMSAAPYRAATSLLQQKKERLRVGENDRFKVGGISPMQATIFWSLDNAGVLGNAGIVYCPRTRTAVTETLLDIHQPPPNHPSLGYSRPRQEDLPGVALLLAGPFGQAHHHVIWDYLAKLALLPENLRKNVDHILIGVSESPMVCDWLQEAGIAPEKIIWLEPGSHFVCEQVIFSSLPCGAGLPRIEIKSALDRLFRNNETKKRDRWLWLSRTQQQERHLSWEQRVLEGIPQLEALDLPSMTAREQINAFREASVVAGPHGSAMANLAFCATGSGTLIEFFSPERMDDPIYERISAVIGWDHYWACTDFDKQTDADRIIQRMRNVLADK